METVRTRFAPSPTGCLHLGHAYSALYAYNFAKERGGEFILRIENIDPTRCKPEYITGIYEDLEWLGLSWQKPVRVQAEHMDDYKAAIARLQHKDLLYPCFCTRKEIQEEVANAGYAPHGPEGTIYPGTCKSLSKTEQTFRMESGENYALRLNLDKALALIPSESLYWIERGEGGEEKLVATPKILGDIVIARKDIGTSYHLSVVVDDALQGITHVTRGQDLQYATHIQRVLQEVLGYTKPAYIHHNIITGPDGKRLAKRDQSQTLKFFRENGYTAESFTKLVSV